MHYLCDNMRTFLAIVLALVLFGIIILLWIGHLDHREPPSEDLITDLYPKSTEDVLKTEIKLYFGVYDDTWQIEDRQINMYSDKIENKIAQVIEEIIKGSEYFKDNPIPKDTQLMSIFLDNRGIVYTDFSEAMIRNHPGGTWGELITIYCLVNTIMANFHTIKGVKILIMGKEVETLKGHIDIRYPLTFRERP